MKEIYVIFECIGSYDDYRETPVCSCGTEGKAKQIIEDLKVNGPLLPFYKESVDKFTEFQEHLADFDQLMDDEKRWDEGGRWFDERWHYGHKNFIPVSQRTEEQNKEEERFRQRIVDEYKEEQLKYMQEAMPGVTKKMLDDYEELQYYMDNPSYMYKKVPYQA